MGSAFCGALAVALGTLALRGAGESGTVTALLATARLGFLLFLGAYAGGALAALFGPVFQPLKKRGRELGLAFASAQTVHLGLVAWLCVIGAAPARATFIFFGAAVLCMYVLALFSIPRLYRMLNPGWWRLLRTVAMNYLAYAFASDFLRSPLHGGAKHVLEYLPFAFLSVAGPAVCLAAFVQRTARSWRQSLYRTG
jgi:hypothetical protein